MISENQLSSTNVPTNKLILKKKPGKTGIVHIGLGNFHRAHLAVYTAKAMQENDGDWGICAFSIFSDGRVAAMNSQDNLYSVLEIGPDSKVALIPGIHTKCLEGPEDIPELIAQISNLETKIVSLTITEAGYYISQSTRGLDLMNQDIKNDIDQKLPKTVYGILVKSFYERIVKNGEPITILSCDNISNNGQMFRQLLMEFIDQLPKNEEIKKFVIEKVSFPNSMVDRIVPGTENRHLDIAFERLGVRDVVPVAAERFSMWALEDKFAAGRPAWELAGAIFTEDVEHYEIMKLRLLNGGHSLLAYLGALMNCETIPDSRFQPLIEKALLKILYDEFLPSITMPTEINSDEYIKELINRWSNTALSDKISRVGTDGSTKLPQRITVPALLAIKNGKNPQLIALTVAAWLMCIASPHGFNAGAIASEMKDPAKEKIRSIAEKSSNLDTFIFDFFKESEIFTAELSNSVVFVNLVKDAANRIQNEGITSAIEFSLND